MGELPPENFETAALLRAVDAIDELRGDLNDNDTLQPLRVYELQHQFVVRFYRYEHQLPSGEHAVVMTHGQSPDLAHRVFATRVKTSL